jgi:hypothetical protein
MVQPSQPAVVLEPTPAIPPSGGSDPEQAGTLLRNIGPGELPSGSSKLNGVTYTLRNLPSLVLSVEVMRGALHIGLVNLRLEQHTSIS